MIVPMLLHVDPKWQQVGYIPLSAPPAAAEVHRGVIEVFARGVEV